MELATAFKPDAAGVLDRFYEAIGIRDLAIGGVEHEHVLSTRRNQPSAPSPVGGIDAVTTSRWHIDDKRVGATREFDQFGEHLGPCAPPPTTITVPCGGPTLGRAGLR